MRHAHRDTSEREADNGLSEKGHKQALLLGKHWEKLLQGKSFVLLSSPKKRCQETLAPLAEALSSSVKICPELDEQSSSEGEVKFNKRIREFLSSWDHSDSESHATTVACSHGDWLPQAIALATGEFVSLKKGAFVVIQKKGAEKPKLVSVVQSLD